MASLGGELSQTQTHLPPLDPQNIWICTSPNVKKEATGSGNEGGPAQERCGLSDRQQQQQRLLCCPSRDLRFRLTSTSERSASSPLLCFQIIARCDVTLLQEVRDRKERALPQLVERLNR